MKLLVPTDFSSLSEIALKFAVDLGRSSGAEIYLVHFMNNQYGSSFSTTGERQMGNSEKDFFIMELAKKNTNRLKELSSEYGMSLKINYELSDEGFIGGINNYIDNNNIDLIVLGTTGERSEEEFFSGNHTEQLIKTSKCPIISLRDDYDFRPIDNIMVGIDLKQDEFDNFSKAADMLNKLAENFATRLHLVHVYDLNDNLKEIQQKVKNFVEKNNFKNYELEFTQSNNKLHGLISYCVARGGSILSVLTHKEDGLFTFFEKEGIAQSLSKTSTIPLLTINLHNI